MQDGLAAPRARPRVYLWFGLAALAATATGFMGTFVLPTLQGRFVAIPFVHLHGALLLAWLLMYVLQSSLVHARRVALHRQFGWLGAALAVAVAISTMAVGVSALHRDLAAGLGQLARSSLVGNFSSPLIYLAFVALAVHWRRRPEVHKRLMLLALLAILWPAFFRFRHFFPPVDNPSLWFGVVLPDTLVLVAMLRDRLVLGRVHPAYLVGGVGLIAENLLEVWMFDGPAWRVLANWLSGFFVAA
jgi:putative Mn2+ efflux pump MntP